MLVTQYTVEAARLTPADIAGVPATPTAIFESLIDYRSTVLVPIGGAGLYVGTLQDERRGSARLRFERYDGAAIALGVLCLDADAHSYALDQLLLATAATATGARVGERLGALPEPEPGPWIYTLPVDGVYVTARTYRLVDRCALYAFSALRRRAQHQECHEARRVRLS